MKGDKFDVTPQWDVWKDNLWSGLNTMCSSETNSERAGEEKKQINQWCIVSLFPHIMSALILLHEWIMIIIVTIIDGSCTAQIFQSRKLTALAHTIHTNIHTDINIIYPSPHTHTHTHHGPLGFVEMPVKKGKFWAGLRSQRGCGDSASWQATNSGQLGQWNWKNGWNRFQIAFRDFQEFFIWKPTLDIFCRCSQALFGLCIYQNTPMKTAYHQENGKKLTARLQWWWFCLANILNLPHMTKLGTATINVYLLTALNVYSNLL